MHDRPLLERVYICLISLLLSFVYIIPISRLVSLQPGEEEEEAALTLTHRKNVL